MVYPIVAQMSPSLEQEPAIGVRGCDVVVTAGAGTGKTRTLVARYLSLLAEGLPLRSIVAITFTRKAAREMRNRIRGEVRRYLDRADLSQEERDRWRMLYAELDAARIGTIHSLCAEILRAHPAEADVDPRFEVLEEGQTNILRGQAVDEALAWAADDDGAAHLFSLVGERNLRAIFDTLLRGRLDVQEAFANLPGDLLAHWCRALAYRQRQALDALLERPEWASAVRTLQHSVATERDDRMELQRQEALAAIRGADGPLADRLASLARVDGINLSGGRRRSWPGGREELDAVREALRTLRTLWRAQRVLLELTISPLDEAMAAALPALGASFAFACRRYEALKGERSALDFDDLEQGALVLLTRDGAVLERWQREVQALLVDEFQDTNARQGGLVRLLNGESGKLFIVGDAKQSIYRFRGADVTVFRSERGRIEGNGGTGFTLATSYRAHRDLIEALNDLLRPVLGDEADPSRPWAEPSAPLFHHREAAGPGFSPPHMELHLTVGSKGAGALDRAADAIAGRILELLEDGAQVVEDGVRRPLDYGDVAILCRASASFVAYEDAMERAGVPFLTVAGRGFYSRPEVRDLLNALQALGDPTDDLALVGLLRSPAMAISDAGIYRLCQARDRAGGATSLWDVLRSGVALTGEDGGRAQRAARMIASLHDQVGRTTVADLLKAFLDATDYRAALIQAGQRRGARNVLKLLADAHASAIVGVGEFVDYVNDLRDAGAREGEARATAEGAVQIMTVHAAKGMEFPVVIVGDVTYGQRGRHGPLIAPGLGVLLPLRDDEDTLPAIYRLGKERADDQEEAELDRLLYVAATRAREKLIFSGCITLKRDNTPARLNGWLGKIAEGLGLEGTRIDYDEEGDRRIHHRLQLGETPVSCTMYEPGHGMQRRDRDTREEPVQPVPLPPPLLEPVPARAEDVDGRTLQQEGISRQRVWRVVPRVARPRAPAWVIGSLVHEALAAWRFPDDGFGHWAEARARGYGVTDRRQLADALQRSRRILLRFQGHLLCREMEAAERRLHEVPYSIEVRGQLQSGIIDALYLSEGLWTIVEFKTDRVADQQGLQALLKRQDYRGQAQRYSDAAEHLLGRRPRSILCMLNYAGTVYLLEPILGRTAGAGGEPLPQENRPRP